jgi:hypothetical protein
MSNHFSAASLKPPGGDPRLDFTDLYAFTSPEDPDKTVVIMDSDPFLLAPAFHPDAVYRLNVDTDGDARPDIAFSFVFSDFDNGAQTVTAYYATGAEAPRPEPPGTSWSPERRSASTTPHSRSMPAGAVSSSECAATRSSPTARPPSTATSGPGWTPSPARTS